MYFLKPLKKLLFFILFFAIIVLAAPAASGIYDRIGIIGEHGLHGAVPEENIDLFTGNLTLKNLDIHLPGPNGFDLNLWRIYNSKVLMDRLGGNTWGIQQEPYSWVGIGWSMHMGRLHSFASETPSIEYPDGRSETAYRNIDDNATFITRDFAKLNKTGWKLYFKDGTVWTFGSLANINYSTGTEQVRVVTQITNSYGHQINITYDASGSPRLKTITDSMGRTINFVLENNYLYKLDYISVKNATGSTVYYDYTVDRFNGDFYKLTGFAPPVIPAVTYEYGSGLASKWELLAVNTSYGGRMEYEYAEQTFYYHVYALQTKVIHQKRIRFSSGAAFKIWTYAYPSYNNSTTGTVTVTGPDSTSYATYHAYTSATPWKVGLLKEKYFSDGSASEQYEWTPKTISTTRWYVLNIDMGQAKAPLLQRTTKNRIGDAGSIEEYLYERSATSRYGLPTRINVYGNGTLKNYKALQYYFENHSTFTNKNLLGVETLNSSNTKLKETIMSYYDNGALSEIRKWKEGGTYLTWDYGYASSNASNITITVDLPGAGGTETMVYSYGILATLTHPGYSEYTRTISSYDSSILSETNQHGAVMSFTYDNLGRITVINMPSGFNGITASWSTNYVTITQGNNTVYKYWDGLGRDTGYAEQGDGSTLFYRKNLDGEGRTVSESKGSTNAADTYSYLYNAAGQVTKITDPMGKITNISLSANNKTVTDANQHATYFVYNNLPGLVTSLTDPAGRTAAFTYDGASRLLSTSYISSRTQSYAYNGLDQVTTENHPETGAITYDYSAANNLETKTWGGIATAYTYNTANQLLTENAGDEQITFTYDGNGRVSAISGGLGWSRTAIGYNAFGNVARETITIPGLSAKTIYYAYDGNNQLAQVTYPDGRSAVCTNNGLNMPETISFAGGTLVNAITYGYGKQPTAINISGNGTSYAAAYNSNGSLTTAQLQKSGTFLYNAGYGYDNIGNITALNNATPALNAAFSYDALNRLTGTSYSPGGIGRVNNFVYNYDEYGNMTQVQENSLTVFNKTYTNQNRANGSIYDARGNVTQGDGLSQAWDNRNRLSESRIIATNSLLGRYLYNERGLRLKAERFILPTVQVVQPNGGEGVFQGDLNTITWNNMGVTGTFKLELLVNGVVAGTIAENLPATQTSYQWQVGKIIENPGWVNPDTNCKVRVSSMALPVAATDYYIYDSAGRLLAEYDQSGTCIKDYIYLGSKLLAEYKPATGQYYYYTSDQINSTRIVTDSAGAIVSSSLYDPYGGVQKVWVDTYHPKLGFSGKERESSSELDYFGARYYGHKQYRFLSVDPVINKDEALANPQLWNLYAYCGNNPISYFDPDGRRIEISATASNQFKNQISQMFSYLHKSGIAQGVINSLQARPETVYIKEKSNEANYRDSDIINMIRIDPLNGNAIGNGNIQSPALALLHEIAHALQSFADPISYKRDVGWKRFDNYDDQEEYRVITKVEIPAAGQLGEPYRFNHRGKDIKVDSPTTKKNNQY